VPGFVTTRGQKSGQLRDVDALNAGFMATTAQKSEQELKEMPRILAHPISEQATAANSEKLLSDLKAY
jgi:hypothetical protein